MPLPRRDKAEEYLLKGVELLLREAEQAPEMRSARRLADEARHAPRPADDARRVLIVTPRDWAAHVQYEAVIAQALRLRGAQVHHLTCGGGLEICDRANTYEAPPMPCRSCSKYVHAALDAHGLDRSAMADGWEADPSWPELDELAAPDLLGVEHAGLPLGSIVDIPLKWFLLAADLGQEPLAGHYHRAFLRSARQIARGIGAALDRIQPDVLLLLNGLFLFEGIAWALAKQRGIDVVTYERAFLKETLVFSRGVPAGFYDFGDEWDPERPLADAEAAALDEYLAQRRGGEAFDQFWGFEDHAEASPTEGKLAVLFTNLTWDTAVIGRDAGFDGIRSWLDAVVAEFRARTRDRLVIRVHPSENRLPGKRTRDSLGTYLLQRYPDLPPNITIVGPDDLRSSYALMDACDVGLVYSSTTGLELALGGTPVVVGAEVHYRDKGFTIDVSSPGELGAALDRCFADDSYGRPDLERARRYAHFFFFRAPIAAPGVREPLPGLARLTVDRLEDLAPGANADLDRICSGILHGTSFVRAD
jgi:hypothetical protein